MLISVGPTISEDQGNEPKNMNHGWMKRWNYIVSARKQMITQGSAFKDFFPHPFWKIFSSPTKTFYQDITMISKLHAKKTSDYSSLLNPLDAKFTKWPNTLKMLSVFGHFVGLAFKGLIVVLPIAF